jgi:deoxyribodipyrimidine photo-lyase
MIIYWHKRDLRLIDNPALDCAMHKSIEFNLPFLPIMGLEKDLITSPKTSYEFSDFHQFGYLSAMLTLFQNYKFFGISPLLFTSSILIVLNNIQGEQPIKFLISHQEHGTSGTYDRDKSVEKFCKIHKIKWVQLPPSGVIRNLQSRDTRDKQVKVYINAKVISIPNFKNILQVAWVKKFNSSSSFAELTKQKKAIETKFELQECSEKKGLEVLESFAVDRAKNYRGGISSPNRALTSGSRLSQFLAYGSLSLRYIHQYFWSNIKSTNNLKLRSGMLGAMQRLHWREHFIQRLENDCSMPTHSINPDFDKISYTHDLDFFEKYKTGQTGEVLIDACIRCLNATGFINFRMRALLVSFGIFGLDLDWRELGKYLATIFLDYEPGIHWSQIQMQSGITGFNTIRVYSPHKQLLDQDPDCIFVRKWIPELKNLTNQQILDYPKIDLSELTQGQYPRPIVDFKIACKINKAKTFEAKKSSTKEVTKQVFTKHGSRKKPVKKQLAKKVNKVKTTDLDINPGSEKLF